MSTDPSHGKRTFPKRRPTRKQQVNKALQQDARVLESSSSRWQFRNHESAEDLSVIPPATVDSGRGLPWTAMW